MQKKLKKLMEAARTALKKADEEKDPAKKSELIAEARKLNDEFLSEASKAAYAEGEPAAEEKPEAPAKKEETPAAESKGDMCAKDKEAKEDAADGDAEESKGDEADDAPKPKKKGKKKADDQDDDEDDNVEANRIAIGALLKESKVIVGAKRAAALEKLSLKEAREEIEMLAEDQQLLVKSVLKNMNVPTGNFGKALTESDRDGATETNNHMFADCYR